MALGPSRRSRIFTSKRRVHPYPRPLFVDEEGEPPYIPEQDTLKEILRKVQLDERIDILIVEREKEQPLEYGLDIVPPETAGRGEGDVLNILVLLVLHAALTVNVYAQNLRNTLR